jgi:signal transduction histidine kinase
VNEPTPKRELILVVDDDDSNRLLAEAILTADGYACVAVASGQAAIDAFATAKPALVLLDVLMPIMDGFETLRRLRALPSSATTPIIIVTALSDLASVQRALAAGADDFVTKPYNRLELLLRIRSLVSRRDPGSSDQHDAIASLLVHDLKHPLTTIYFNAGLLRRDTSLNQRARECVARIIRASERLESMILNILDVTQSEETGLPLDRGEFDLGVLLTEVAKAQEPRAEANGQKIEVVDRSSRDHLAADRDVVRRVLENLLDNAQRYAPSQSTIHLEADDVDGQLELRVRDAGPGIPLETRDLVFERRGQAPRTGRAGHGLGLVFVRMAAEAHGGSVQVEDTGATGTCLCVRIPRGTSRSQR